MQIDLNENPGDVNAILAVTDYWCGSYEGNGEAIALEDDGGELIVRVYNLSHCSCYGPLSDPAVESYTLTHYLKKRDNVLCSSVSAQVQSEFDKLLDEYLAKTDTKEEKAGKINISISLDNEAFTEDPVGEVSRILEEIVSKIQDNGTVQCDIPLRDINGNLVGQFEYQE